MAGKSPRWLPIESNPGVISKFLQACGLPKTWAMTDVFGLDPELLCMLPQPVVSLMLLFPISEKYKAFWLQQEEELKKSGAAKEVPEGLYYMKQTISNACGTVAAIHAVANSLDVVQLESGFLKAFLDETKHMSPYERAVALENNDDVCEKHDEVARQGQTAAPNLDDDVEYHFVAFVHKDGFLYELDGRKSMPIRCGKSSRETFLNDAAEECKRYMGRDPDNINFTVIALAKAED